MQRQKEQKRWRRRKKKEESKEGEEEARVQLGQDTGEVDNLGGEVDDLEDSTTRRKKTEDNKEGDKEARVTATTSKSPTIAFCVNTKPMESSCTCMESDWFEGTQRFQCTPQLLAHPIFLQLSSP